MVTADEALQMLQDGHGRYLSGRSTLMDAVGPERRSDVAEVQTPFAAVLGCADSRVPPEVVFDQGLGELFVVRVAGHVIGPATVGSLEFGTRILGARLIVVLGHSRCGAVQAALSQDTELSPALATLVARVHRATAATRAAHPEADADELMEAAVRAHVLGTVDRLGRESPVLARLVESDGLRIVGAEYSTDTGEVAFLEAADPP